MKQLTLQIDKPEKSRAGLYLDKDLHDELTYIAEASGVSFNEAAIELIKTGIETAKNNQ